MPISRLSVTRHTGARLTWLHGGIYWSQPTARRQSSYDARLGGRHAPILGGEVAQEQQVAPRVLLATAHLPLSGIRVELEPVKPRDEAPVVDVFKSLGTRRSVKQVQEKNTSIRRLWAAFRL